MLKRWSFDGPLIVPPFQELLAPERKRRQRESMDFVILTPSYKIQNPPPSEKRLRQNFNILSAVKSLEFVFTMWFHVEVCPDVGRRRQRAKMNQLVQRGIMSFCRKSPPNKFNYRSRLHLRFREVSIFCSKKHETAQTQPGCWWRAAFELILAKH